MPEYVVRKVVDALPQRLEDPPAWPCLQTKCR
jgi:hypothetical protein